mgnify:CR=1 FL=1
MATKGKGATKVNGTRRGFVITEETMDQVPQFLWDMRSTQGIPQSEVAAKMGRLQSHVSNIENPKKLKIPTIKVLVDYLTACGGGTLVIFPPRGYTGDLKKGAFQKK